MTGWNNSSFESLESVGLGGLDIAEVGNIEDRAKDKAFFISDNYADIASDFDFIIGIDDGFEIKSKIEPEVKKLLPHILGGDLLKENEIIYDCRAICLIKPDASTVRTILRLPFKYKRNLDAAFKDNSYPLSHTLTPVNDDRFIVDLSEDEQFNYYLEQCSVEMAYLFDGAFN